MSNDKLAEALEHTARHRAATEGIDPDQWRVVLFKWEALALQAHAAEVAQARAKAPVSMLDVDTMVTRFLSWRLPKSFAPDAGISFKPMPDIYMPHCWPIGTNLFDAGQAKEMILHMLGDDCAAATQPQAAEPVAWSCQDTINDDDGCPIGMDEPRVHWGSGCPDDDGGWLPLYTHPQPAQDASNPLKGWIFDKVNMGRGDERYICTPNGANATTVRNESTSDHRERLLWLIADAMAKGSGR